MASPKSPFLVFQNFLSPKACESIVDSLGFYSPDLDQEGNPIKMFRFHSEAEELVFSQLKPLTEHIAHHYGTGYRGTEQIVFEYLAEGTVSEPLCENSNYVKKKWVRTRDRDLTGMLFLSDYNDNPPFDSDYEVYGGNLEFPQHGMKFHPQRGTLIVYPSGPHFINANSAVVYGDLFQARIHIATSEPLLYDPRLFPGDYRTWFKNYM